MKRTATVVALGLLAVAAPFAISYIAEAEQPEPQPLTAGIIDVGTTEVLNLDLNTLENTEQVFNYPGADYVKVHFANIMLAPGDSITVQNPDGSESYDYDASLLGGWANSISGDTAIVKLNSAQSPISEAFSSLSSLGVTVDKIARGFSPEETATNTSRQHTTESVCGRDDQRDAVCYKETEPDIYNNAQPVARLLINGTTVCTAFRVGTQNRLLTNNHCFDNTTTARNTEVWFGFQCATCGGNNPQQVVKVRGDKVLSTNKTYDYTLFTVQDFDRIEQFGHLTLADRATTSGEKLYIPQHPAGDPTQIAIDSDSDMGACQVDNPDFEGYATGSDVSYYCDTAFGSSGSPVLSRDTHEVIALHHFGGCPNSGVRSDRILERIKDLI